MVIIKCKMCGGDITLTEDKTVGMCDYCGSTMTFPKLDDDQRTATFNRGNHFRRIGEFDKALSVYEHIVREDNTDAEAHWCCALCRFGIEYVEDPATLEYLPTCQRASFDSFLEDVDYLAALEHSDGITRRQYQKDAAKIAEVQRGILATSQNEKPFDVFICYKESDENGQRTRDSLMAQDVYYQLTDSGYRVFFARITLEDITGKQYEPYIFAALNSAKVMVVIGTKPEHMNAVWVKNEWGRFLTMMKKDRHKLILPCYRDMDPYDMPEQLSVLQSYDMGKIGFIQDLIRGIKKVLDAEKKPEPVEETVVVQQTSNSNIAPLLKRAFIFLEDGDWERADEFCEQVLNLDPECAEAYLGKLMAELQVKKQKSLKDQAKPFDGSNNYQKVVRYANETLKTELAGYIEHIKTRNENARLEGIYDRAMQALTNKSAAENYYNEVAQQFESISNYKDAADKAKECYEMAEAAQKDAIFFKATATMASLVVPNLKTAITLFKSISGWRDADEQIVICQKKIEEIEAKEEADRLERERQAEIARKAAEKRAKLIKKIAIIATPIVCAVIAFVIILNAVIIPNNKYNKAMALMDEGKYTEAISAFEALGNYKNSSTMISDCRYNNAVALMDEGKYAEAISEFEALGNYKNSSTMISDCRYNNAVALMDGGKYAEAISAFEALGNYKDSAAMLSKCIENEKNMFIAEHGQAAYDKWGLLIVGDYLNFGSYEQDNKIKNGKEPIEWLVLEVRDGKALVISKHSLDCQQYNIQETDTTWETCTLRQWLNNDFLNDAFSDAEKEMIPTVTVSADKHPKYDTDSGSDTQDKVFLLSVTEVNQYFDSDSTRICSLTPYAKAKTMKGKIKGFWWLRSPGFTQIYATAIYDNGTIDNYGNKVSQIFGIRPAMWIDLNA